MSSVEIISLVVTLVCVISFSVVFTILFRNYYYTNIENVKTGREDADLIEQAVYQQKEANNKTKRGLKKALRITEYVIMGAISAFFVFSMYCRFSNNILMFGKASFIVIATDSMSLKNSNNTYLVDEELDNQFNAHDIIGLAPYDSEDDVKLYDVIAYKSRSETVVVHRIRVIETLADGTKAYHTRGDKNSIDDDNNLYEGYLTYDDIIGYYTGHKVPDLGIFIIFVQSNAGIITIVSIVYCLLMYDRLSNKYSKAVDERTKFLIDTLNFNPEVDDKNSVVTQYKETIFFNGNCHVFESGKFVTSFLIEGIDVNKTIAEEAAGAKIPDSKEEITSESKPEASSSLPEAETLEKEESPVKPFSPTDLASESQSEKQSDAEAAPSRKRVKEKKARKKPKVEKEKDYDSFFDHLDDTENIT